MKRARIILVFGLAIAITLLIVAAVRYIPIPGMPQLLQKVEKVFSTKTSQPTEQSGSSLRPTSTQKPNAKKSLIHELTSSEDFKKVAKKPGNAVIKFFSPWCPACMMAKAALPEVAKSVEGKVTLYTVDTSHAGLVALATQEGLVKDEIEAIPTFVFIKDGKALDDMRGFKDAQTLIDEIKTQFNL